MFSKSCSHCSHFKEFHEANKVLPNKTVVTDTVHMRWCGHGSFELHDIKPCAEFTKAGSRSVDPNGIREFDARTHGLL